MRFAFRGVGFGAGSAPGLVPGGWCGFRSYSERLRRGLRNFLVGKFRLRLGRARVPGASGAGFALVSGSGNFLCARELASDSSKLGGTLVKLIVHLWWKVSFFSMDLSGDRLGRSGAGSGLVPGWFREVPVRASGSGTFRCRFLLLRAAIHCVCSRSSCTPCRGCMSSCFHICQLTLLLRIAPGLISKLKRYRCS